MADPKARYAFAELRERLRERGDVLDFALGSARHPPPEAVTELLRTQPELALRPGRPEEMEELLGVSAAHFSRRFGVELSANQILPLASGRGAINALASTLLEPGDRAVVTVPGYPSFARLAAEQGARVVEIPFDPERGFRPARPSVDACRNEANEAGAPVRMVGLNYPNNPTGAILTEQVLADFGVLLGGSDSILFNDATYGPLVWQGPAQSLLGLSDWPAQLELHSLGKLYALGPTGIAFLLGSPDLIERIQHFCEYASSPLSAQQVYVAMAALGDSSYLDGIQRIYRQRVERLQATLKDIGVDAYPTPGGLYVLSPPPAAIDGVAISGKSGMNGAREAAERMLAELDLAVVAFDSAAGSFLRFSGLFDEAHLPKLAQLKGRLEGHLS